MMFQAFLQSNNNSLFHKRRKLFSGGTGILTIDYLSLFILTLAPAPAATTRDFFGDVSLAPRVRLTDFRLRK